MAKPTLPTKLYCIQCVFQPRKSSKEVWGIAIGTDPDTPIQFIYPNGKVYGGKAILSYRLIHNAPWIGLEVGG